MRTIAVNIIQLRGVADRGRGRSGHQSRRGSKFCGKMDILNEKVDFQHSANFKLLSRIQGNPINIYDFFLKFIISVRGGHFDYSFRAPKA
jgi:hypothetical protein